MFERILIANRGEVATRVARTCRRLGVETVAVHVGVDAGDLHVAACDEGVAIGDTSAAYHDPAAMVAAAKGSGVHAVHPGYGALADDPTFAKAVEDAGLIFVGPASERSAALRDRLAVRSIAHQCGVRVLPASERPITGPQLALLDVDEIGYPVVVRPVIGDELAGAVANDVAELAEALANLDPLDARGGAYVERYVERARHVEVQLMVHGAQAFVLGDREVSLRREGRRILCESPAPAIDQLHDAEAVRGAMWEAATELGSRLDCDGLGSAHFLLDADGRFHFVSFTPGLQVEHSTIEMCSGLDLVELQLLLAAGEPAVDGLEMLEPSGSAFQALIHAARDPNSGSAFESSVESARWPPAPQGKVRIETGVQPGSHVSAELDPLLATVTTYAPNRHDALLMLDRILAEIHLAPVVTNQRLLRLALNDESVQAGQYDEDFVDRM